MEISIVLLTSAPYFPSICSYLFSHGIQEHFDDSTMCNRFRDFLVLSRSFICGIPLKIYICDKHFLISIVKVYNLKKLSLSMFFFPPIKCMFVTIMMM